MPAGADNFVLLAVVLAAVGLIVIVALLRGATRARPLPYFSRKFLLTQGEAAFYQVLRQAVPDGMALSFKVRLCDLIDCATEARRDGYWAKISQKHIDFVIVDAADTSILLAIELDDRSHDRKERRERDEFVDAALQVAGIAMLRVPAAKDYDVREIKLQVAQRLPKKAKRAA